MGISKIEFWNVSVGAEDIESGETYQAMLVTVKTSSPYEARNHALALCKRYDDIHEGYKHYLSGISPAQGA